MCHPFRCHTGQAEAADQHLQTCTQGWCGAASDDPGLELESEWPGRALVLEKLCMVIP